LVSHNLYKKTEFGNAKIANVVASWLTIKNQSIDKR
jgi:hypothetical protein